MTTKTDIRHMAINMKSSEKKPVIIDKKFISEVYQFDLSTHFSNKGIGIELIDKFNVDAVSGVECGKKYKVEIKIMEVE